MWRMKGLSLSRLALLVVVLILVFGGTYLHGTTSEPFEFGRQFVAEDSRITSLTGPQRKQRLSLLKGFEYSYSDANGEASLTISVLGDRGQFDVPLVLKKRRGQWQVVNAKVLDDHGQVLGQIEPGLL